MVEFICLEDVEGLQTMPRHCHVFTSGFIQYYIRVHLELKLFFFVTRT